MNSNPNGAEVFVNGNRVGTTPMSIDLSKSQSQQVVFRLSGRGDVTCILNRKVGAGWVVLDVLAGLVPVIIDAGTGSWYSFDKNACNATFGGADLSVDLNTLTAAQRDAYAGQY